MKNILFSVLMSGFFVFGNSQNVVRGPYLQSPNDTSVVVMWRTDQPTNSQLWFGNSPGNLVNTINLNNSATDHSILVGNLNPFTRYYYAVGDNSGILAGQTPQHFFTTHPVPGTEMPIRVWSIGDFGKGNTEQVDVKDSYVNFTDTTLTNVWLWLGDNAYDNGEDNEYQNKVFGLTGFSDIFSWLPFYPCPGNHDYGEVWVQSTLLGIPYTNIPLEDHTGPYFEIVDVPEEGEAGGVPSQLEVFYSYDYGNVHFLSLNSEVYDFTNSFDGVNAMINWITADLAQNDKLFTIAYFHQPPYSKGSHDSDDAYELVMKAMRERIIPVLESFDIDLVVCGHSHVYERSFLINGHYDYSTTFDAPTMLKDGSNGNFAAGTPYIKDTLNNNNEGTVYVVCGNGGSSETAPALNHPVMSFTDGGSSAVGSFVMDIYKNRLDGKYLKADGTIADNFTLLKKNLNVFPIADYSICEGDSIVIAANYSGGSDSLEFLWSPGSETTPAISISPLTGGSFSVSVTDLLTGQIVSRTFNVIVSAIPTPVINAMNDTLFTQTGYSYQWFLNGSAISGATNYFYVPVTNGNYTVELINGACSVLSSSVPVNSVSVFEIAEQEIQYYPNPVQRELTITINHPDQWNEIRITDLLGNSIYSGRPKASVQINVEENSAGIYFLHLSGENKSKMFKIIVEK